MSHIKVLKHGFWSMEEMVYVQKQIFLLKNQNRTKKSFSLSIFRPLHFMANDTVPPETFGSSSLDLVLLRFVDGRSVFFFLFMGNSLDYHIKKVFLLFLAVTRLWISCNIPTCEDKREINMGNVIIIIQGNIHRWSTLILFAW